MRKPIVGVITNNVDVENGYVITGAGIYELEAIAKITKATPILLPACRNVVEADVAMEICDGFYFPGGRANVHPSHYGHELTQKHGTMNECRDKLSLSLIKQAIEAAKPIFCVCRGHQELAVAFGSTLHPEVRELPGRMNHRMPPDGTQEEKFALRHPIEIQRGGLLERILGNLKVEVNSLHGQAIDQLGARVVVEAVAPDQTIEAISIKDAKNFALGVQFHPEYKAGERDVSRKLFEAFGQALRGVDFQLSQAV